GVVRRRSTVLRIRVPCAPLFCARYGLRPAAPRAGLFVRWFLVACPDAGRAARARCPGDRQGLHERHCSCLPARSAWVRTAAVARSEEHTSESQSSEKIVCSLQIE